VGAAAGLAADSEDLAVAEAAAVAGARVGKMCPMTITRRTLLRTAVAAAMLPLTGCSYNKFVGEEENVKAQWAQVQNQLQRRNDLIPNLVETTKGFAQHEETVYKEIADARSQLLSAKSPEE